MSDRAIMAVLLYMAFAFAFGVLVGKTIKRGREDDR